MEGCVYLALQELIKLRKTHHVFSGSELEVIPTRNDHVLGFICSHGTDRALIFANFSETSQTLTPQVFQDFSLDEVTLIHGSSSFIQDGTLQMQRLEFLVFKTI